MIKVGILEAASATGAQLVRILLHHPDVHIVWAQSSLAQGPLSATIRGIAGDTDLSFTRSAFSPVAVIINCSTAPVTGDFVASIAADPAKIRIIELAATDLPDTFIYGLCELNRKALVRGALTARNPTPLAMAVELALLPLAKHLMLTAAVNVAATVGVAATKGISRRGMGMLPESEEIASALRLAQSSFYQQIDIVEMRAGGADGLMAIITLPTAMPLGSLLALYEETYSDHNFTFVSREPIDTRDVLGTNKCLLHLDKNSDTLRITVALDPRIKGTAGNAVHILNLLFGLHECTGLNLIASSDQ